MEDFGDTLSLQDGGQGTEERSPAKRQRFGDGSGAAALAGGGRGGGGDGSGAAALAEGGREDEAMDAAQPLSLKAEEATEGVEGTAGGSDGSGRSLSSADQRQVLDALRADGLGRQPNDGSSRSLSPREQQQMLDALHADGLGQSEPADVAEVHVEAAPTVEGDSSDDIVTCGRCNRQWDGRAQCPCGLESDAELSASGSESGEATQPLTRTLSA
jgi:hypothetical protein